MNLPAPVATPAPIDPDGDDFEATLEAVKTRGMLYSFIINCRVKGSEPPPAEKKTTGRTARPAEGAKL